MVTAVQQPCHITWVQHRASAPTVYDRGPTTTAVVLNCTLSPCFPRTPAVAATPTDCIVRAMLQGTEMGVAAEGTATALSAEAGGGLGDSTCPLL